jgi:hypothetical protein
MHLQITLQFSRFGNFSDFITLKFYKITKSTRGTEITNIMISIQPVNHSKISNKFKQTPLGYTKELTFFLIN